MWVCPVDSPRSYRFCREVSGSGSWGPFCLWERIVTEQRLWPVRRELVVPVLQLLQRVRVQVEPEQADQLRGGDRLVIPGHPFAVIWRAVAEAQLVDAVAQDLDIPAVQVRVDGADVLRMV